jgi:hypothetical protein
MKIFNRILLFVLICSVVACEHLDTDFESFLQNGEIIYPGVISDVSYRPGNERVALLWHPSPDPTVEKYVVYWNNKKDSIVVAASTHDPSAVVSAIIEDLDEYVYTFTVYSYDADGNRSVPKTINNVKVYGPLYEGNLLNRPYNATTPYVVNENGSVTLNFNEPDTINITTTIRYTNTSNDVVETELAPENTSITLNDYKGGTIIEYRSAYIPMENAIDTFYVSSFAMFPQVYTYQVVNKGSISALSLPFDVSPYQWDTNISRLWDGSSGPQGYPNIWHSDGGSQLPHHFTFDLGQTYETLSHIEVTGRNCCHNPDVFEVWGTNDLTNASTTVPGNDAGWKDNSIAKGWTLLKEVTRTDDGQAPLKVALNSGIPPVRYIRIRIKHVVSGESAYSNLSELTFWSRQ